MHQISSAIYIGALPCYDVGRMANSAVCPRCGKSDTVALAPDLLRQGWYACRDCGHLWKTRPDALAPPAIPQTVEYDCALCGDPIEGDPYWCHPVMATKAHAEEVVGLGGRILQASKPPVEIAAGAMPFHKHCLEARIGRRIPQEPGSAGR